MNRLFVAGGRTLLGHDLIQTSLSVADDRIGEIGVPHQANAATLDARNLLVLPGIVDIHGDAFERQMMPRAGVDFPIDVFHATTWSWEPGLRSGDNARGLLEAIESLQPQLAADTRFHLRHETYNLDAEDEICQWLAARRIDLLAFNDHMDTTVASLDKPHKRQRMVDRTGLSGEDFDRLVERVTSRADDVPASIARLAMIARTVGVRMLSHDDDTPEMRQAFRAQGIAIAEFPVNEETAREAASGGDAIVFGAPNVVRGGSHTGWTRASDMIAKGLCSVLASDYYYPAPLLAAFRLAADGVLPLPQAWDLVSKGPAHSAGLSDRGTLAQGQRADILLIDDQMQMRPRVVAVIAGGRLVHLTEASRLAAQPVGWRETVAAE
jgi:alpha-D-ribose 1-methylphosphonate 5-triphosphate diphosphatase